MEQVCPFLPLQVASHVHLLWRCAASRLLKVRVADDVQQHAWKLAREAMAPFELETAAELPKGKRVVEFPRFNHQFIAKRGSGCHPIFVGQLW